MVNKQYEFQVLELQVYPLVQESLIVQEPLSLQHMQLFLKYDFYETLLEFELHRFQLEFESSYITDHYQILSVMDPTKI